MIDRTDGSPSADNARSGPKTEQRRPFKFLDPYTIADRDIFFSRDDELQDLYRRFFAAPVTLLYGESGSGKTSLVECGLFSEIPRGDLLAITVRSVSDPVVTLRADLQRIIARRNAPLAERLREAPEAELIHAAIRVTSKPVALFFDQFEELFILNPEAVRLCLAGALRQWLDAGLDLRILISIRSEYLARLAEIEQQVPEILENRLWLRRMPVEQARDAIVRPCEVCGVEIAPAVVETVLRAVGSTGSSEVELPLLQAVMDRLYEESARSGSELVSIDAGDLERAGGLEQILGRFIDSRLDSLRPAQAAEALLKCLVTPEGTKHALGIGELTARARAFGSSATESEVEGLLGLMVNGRLVRQLPDQGLFELRHDILAKVVQSRLTPIEMNMLDTRRMLSNRLAEYRSAGRLLDAEAVLAVNRIRGVLTLTPDEEQLLTASERAIHSRRMQTDANTAILLWSLASSGSDREIGPGLGRRLFDIINNATPDFEPLTNLLRNYYALKLSNEDPDEQREETLTVGGYVDFLDYLPTMIISRRDEFLDHVRTALPTQLAYPDADVLGQLFLLLAGETVPPALAHLASRDDQDLARAGFALRAVAAMERGSRKHADEYFSRLLAGVPPLTPAFFAEAVRQTDELLKKHMPAGQRALREEEAARVLRRLSNLLQLAAGVDLLEKDPAWTTAWWLDELGLKEECITLLAAAQPLDTPFFGRWRARLLVKHDDPILRSEGLLAFNALIDRFPESRHDILERKANACFDVHLYEHAIDAYSACIEVSPNQEHCAYRLAQSIAAVGRPSEAAAMLLQQFRRWRSRSTLVAWLDALHGEEAITERLASLDDLVNEVAVGHDDGKHVPLALHVVLAEHLTLCGREEEASALLDSVSTEGASPTDRRWLTRALARLGRPVTAAPLATGDSRDDHWYARDALIRRVAHGEALPEPADENALRNSPFERMKQLEPRNPYNFLLEFIILRQESLPAFEGEVWRNIDKSGTKNLFQIRLLKHLLSPHRSTRLRSTSPAELCEAAFYQGIVLLKEGQVDRARAALSDCLSSKKNTEWEYEIASDLLKRLDFVSLPQLDPLPSPTRETTLKASEFARGLFRHELVEAVRSGSIAGDVAKRHATDLIDTLELKVVDFWDLKSLVVRFSEYDAVFRRVEKRFSARWPLREPLYLLVRTAMRGGDIEHATEMLASADRTHVGPQVLRSITPDSYKDVAETIIRAGAAPGRIAVNMQLAADDPELTEDL